MVKGRLHSTRAGLADVVPRIWGQARTKPHAPSVNLRQLVEEGIRADPDAPILGEVPPHHCPLPVDEEGRRSGNVSLHSSFHMSDTVCVDDLEIRIRQNAEVDTPTARKVKVSLDRINGHGEHFRVCRPEVVDTCLQTLQF